MENKKIKQEILHFKMQILEMQIICAGIEDKKRKQQVLNKIDRLIEIEKTFYNLYCRYENLQIVFGMLNDTLNQQVIENETLKLNLPCPTL